MFTHFLRVCCFAMLTLAPCAKMFLRSGLLVPSLVAHLLINNLQPGLFLDRRGCKLGFFLLGLAAQAAGALIKGLSDRHDARQARRQAKRAVGYDLPKLVHDAQVAGFNPLTVLNATGGANYARVPLPTVPSLGHGVSAALAQAGASFIDQGQFQRSLDENARQFNQSQYNRLFEAQSYRVPSANTHFGGGDPNLDTWSGWRGAPRPEPMSAAYSSWGMTPVDMLRLDGSHTSIPQAAAYSLRLNPGEYINQDDYESIFGDSIAEVDSAWKTAGWWDRQWFGFGPSGIPQQKFGNELRYTPRLTPTNPVAPVLPPASPMVPGGGYSVIRPGMVPSVVPSF